MNVNLNSQGFTYPWQMVSPPPEGRVDGAVLKEQTADGDQTPGSCPGASPSTATPAFSSRGPCVDMPPAMLLPAATAPADVTPRCSSPATASCSSVPPFVRGPVSVPSSVRDPASPAKACGMSLAAAPAAASDLSSPVARLVAAEAARVFAEAAEAAESIRTAEAGEAAKIFSEPHPYKDFWLVRFSNDGKGIIKPGDMEEMLVNLSHRVSRFETRGTEPISWMYKQ